LQAPSPSHHRSQYRPSFRLNNDVQMERVK
jgi:hypothetical protein